MLSALLRKHTASLLLLAHSCQRMAGRLLALALPRVRPIMVSTRAAAGLDTSLSSVSQRLRAADGALPRAPVSDKHAGCLVPLFEDAAGCVRVWLTRRSKTLRTHAGEVCLPGGRRDEEDGGDDVATALREAQEELGLDPSRTKVLCKLPPFLSKHHLSVTPVVAQVPADFRPAMNPDEVDAAFHMPLAAFLDSEHHLHWDVGGKANRIRYRIHSFDYVDRGGEHYVIWGLTASMLIRVAELAFGRPPAFEVNGRGCTCPSQLAFDGQRVTSLASGAAAGASSSGGGGGGAAAAMAAAEAREEAAEDDGEESDEGLQAALG